MSDTLSSNSHASRPVAEPSNLVNRNKSADIDLKGVYNRFADTYHSNRGNFDISALLDALLAGHCIDHQHLLDLGCGAGEPVASTFLKQGWTVTGVDFSPRMLDLAGTYAPGMIPVCADMRDVNFHAEAFSIITIVYALFHLSAEDHPSLLTHCFDWLAPGGQLLFTYATESYTGQPTFDGMKIFMGESLYYSHREPTTIMAVLNDIGFAIERADNVTLGGETFLWVSARKPKA